jgi:hypothetical protein
MATLREFKLPLCDFDFDVDDICFGVFVGPPTANVLLSPLAEGEVRPEKQIFIRIWPAAHEDLMQFSFFREATCEQYREREELWIGLKSFVFRAPGVLKTEERDYSNCTDFPEAIAETIGDCSELERSKLAVFLDELKVGIDMNMRGNGTEEDQETLKMRDWSFPGFWKLCADLAGLDWPDGLVIALMEVNTVVLRRCQTFNRTFAWLHSTTRGSLVRTSYR